MFKFMGSKSSLVSLLWLLAIAASYPHGAVAADVDINSLLQRAKIFQDNSGYVFPYFNRNHPMKAVFQLPDDPKTWPTLPLVLTHNVLHMVGHGVPIDFVLVAPGSSIRFFMKDYWPDGGVQLKRLHDMGVKMVACRAAVEFGNVDPDKFLPFVGQASESGIVYILKKQAEGFASYKFR